jgi:predicted transport protein
MLLIDGVKYTLWNPPSEDEFESAVKEHVNEIFGEQCIYLDKKQKLKSLSGIGSIPDGLAIILGAQPELHIVEYELSNHDVYGHVVSQISKFINGLLNSSTRQKIARIIYDEISGDQLLKVRVEQALHSSEIFKFSTELLERKPILTIIIENETDELKEALKPFSYQNIKDMKIVEFQTFIREGVGLAVHAHSFKPVYVYPPQIPAKSEEINPPNGTQSQIDEIDNLLKTASQEIEGLFWNLRDRIVEFGHVAEVFGKGYVDYRKKTTFTNITIQSNRISVLIKMGEQPIDDPKNITTKINYYSKLNRRFYLNPGGDLDYAIHLIKQAYDYTT